MDAIEVGARLGELRQRLGLDVERTRRPRLVDPASTTAMFIGLPIRSASAIPALTIVRASFRSSSGR
jgi:hypothetical protein